VRFVLCLVRFRYIFGVTHVPRLEDWPIMPCEYTGFNLMVSRRAPRKCTVQYCQL